MGLCSTLSGRVVTIDAVVAQIVLVVTIDAVVAQTVLNCDHRQRAR
jgi:hypothetical protein